ncbi:hypothetical protein AB0J90_25010 [Micromonospora sp. NPDC049523]|uniref:hypothetical protein n=1 Tax=Micromonospora sp. NPDC049523 TaxID=3155921 RepID=UPI0034186EF5
MEYGVRPGLAATPLRGDLQGRTGWRRGAASATQQEWRGQRGQQQSGQGGEQTRGHAALVGLRPGLGGWRRGAGRRQSGRWRYRRQRPGADTGAAGVVGQQQDPAGLDHRRVAHDATVGLRPSPVEVEDLAVALAVAERLGGDREEEFALAVDRITDDVKLLGRGRGSRGRGSHGGGSHGGEGQGRGSHGGESYGGVSVRPDRRTRHQEQREHHPGQERGHVSAIRGSDREQPSLGLRFHGELLSVEAL